MHLSFDFLDPIPEYKKIADLEADVQNLIERVEELEGERKQLLAVAEAQKVGIYRGKKVLFSSYFCKCIVNQ